MEYHTIITHEYPDLDAMLCCYLLMHYGNQCYPGIEHAKIQFIPAGQLQKAPDDLEKEGILAVDLGGGKFDTHPNGMECEEEKFELSAANLVAREIGVADRLTLKNLLEFTRLQDSAGQSLHSRNPVDHTVALPNLIKGALLYFKEDFLEMTQFFMKIFQGIEIAEEHKDDPFALLPPDQLLVTIHSKQVHTPPLFNFHSFFALWAAQKFLYYSITESPLSTDANPWYDLKSFVAGHGFQELPEL